jgi:hypothetical protein
MFSTVNDRVLINNIGKRKKKTNREGKNKKRKESIDKKSKKDIFQKS